MWRLPIQNHPKPHINEKRRNKAKYLTSKSIKPKFVKKTSMPNSVESLGYIKCYSLSSPDLLKALAILSDTTVRRSAVDQDLKLYWKSEKGPHFSRWSSILIFTGFSKTLLTTERPNRVIPNILKYMDHQCDLPTIWKTRLSQTHLEEFS